MYRYRLYRRSATARKNDLGRHADGSSPVALSVSKKGRPRSRWAQRRAARMGATGTSTSAEVSTARRTMASLRGEVGTWWIRSVIAYLA